MQIRKPRTSRALLDIILSVLGMVILLINVPGAKELVPPIKYMLTVSWEDATTTDIDTHILTPDNKHIFFSQKNSGDVALNRDDLGVRGDPSDINLEMVSFRGLTNGIYYISIHNYNDGNSPTKFVKLALFNFHSGLRIYNNIVDSPSGKEELPIFKFFVKDGKITKAEESNRYVIGNSR